MGKKKDQQRLAVLASQRALRDDRRALIILVAGVDGCGRHAVINALTHGLDPRGVRVNAWPPEAAPGRHHLPLWRYWNALPDRGQVGLFLDGWYAAAIDDALRGDAPTLEHLSALEAQLTADGAVLLKLWIDLPAPTARKRIRSRIKAEAREPTPGEQAVLAAQASADDALAALRDASGGWVHLNGAKPGKAADQALEALVDAVTVAQDWAPPKVAMPRKRGSASPLTALDPDARLKKKDYKAELPELQAEIARRIWAAHARRQPVVWLFEGWDAAGKGGVIRRLTERLDARLFQVEPIAAPSDAARAHPWLWRFWQRLPRDGQLTVFDRSWYGRVLVERVEGFATEAEWRRAYAEINDFESQLVAHGTVLVKFWLEITPEAQLKRFEARAETPHKQHKLTDEDWRNRDRWDAYQATIDDMLRHTHTVGAPWTLLAANCKRHARVTALQAVIDALPPA